MLKMSIWRSSTQRGGSERRRYMYYCPKIALNCPIKKREFRFMPVRIRDKI